jgi:hypothetical protein
MATLHKPHVAAEPARGGGRERRRHVRVRQHHRRPAREDDRLEGLPPRGFRGSAVIRWIDAPQNMRQRAVPDPVRSTVPPRDRHRKPRHPFARRAQLARAATSGSSTTTRSLRFRLTPSFRTGSSPTAFDRQRCTRAFGVARRNPRVARVLQFRRTPLSTRRCAHRLR